MRASANLIPSLETTIHRSRYLIAPLALVLPTQCSRANFFKLTGLSLVVTSFFMFLGSFAFPGGAHLFMKYAQYFIDGKTMIPEISQRDAGYPLLMLATGVQHFHTFMGLALVQTMFAFLMPLLIYRIVERFDCRAAYWAGILAIVSMGPYQFMRWIHHDQPYIFFGVLGCYIFSLFIYSGRKRDLVMLGVVFSLMSITRPAGNWIYVIMAALALFAHPRQWRFILLNLAAFLVMLSLYTMHREHAFKQHAEDVMPGYSGIQTLYNLIVKSDDFGVTITPETGPALHKLYEMSVQSLQPSPEKSPSLQAFVGSMRQVYTPEFYKKNFTGMSAETLARKLFTEPNYEYYIYLSRIGGYENDKLFFDAAKEIARAHPLFVVEYIGRSLWHMLANPGFSDTRGNNNNMSQEGIFLLPLNGQSVNAPVGIIPPHAERELRYDPTQSVFLFTAPFQKYLSGMVGRLYRPFVKFTFPFTLVAMLSALYYLLVVRVLRKHPPKLLARSLTEQSSLVVMGITGVYLYNCLVTAIFVDPSMRYHYFVVLFHTTLTAIGGYVLWMMLLSCCARCENALANVRLPIYWFDRIARRRVAYSYLILLLLAAMAAWVLQVESVTMLQPPSS